MVTTKYANETYISTVSTISLDVQYTIDKYTVWRKKKRLEHLHALFSHPSSRNESVQEHI